MKTIRAVILCVCTTLISAVVTYQSLMVSCAHDLEDVVEAPLDTGLRYALSSVDLPDYSIDYHEVSVMSYGLPIEEMSAKAISQDVTVGTLCIVPGIDIKNNAGVYIHSDDIVLEYSSVIAAFNSDYPSMDWDHKNKINIAAALWEFLVVQNNIDEYNAAALIGNVMYEGTFGMKQGDYTCFTDIEQARRVLGSGECGYGVAQWTYHTRQKTLLEYYELTNSIIDDWQSAVIVAECCHLLSEVKAYEIFDDIYSHYTIEDAVGRVARDYETYDGCYEQWKVIDGVYTLVSSDGSGKGRLQYAINIYEYFTGLKLE